MEKSLVLIKPDALHGGKAGAVLSRLESAGLRVENARYVDTTLEQWQRHYADLKARNARAFERTTKDLAGQPVIAMILAGTDAVKKIRALAGPTDPSAAPPGTIRGDLGADSMEAADAENRSTRNLLHAADSHEAAVRETAIWFGNAS